MESILQLCCQRLILSIIKSNGYLLFIGVGILSMNNLRRVDLNLLVALHTLLVEKHISRSAVHLNRSQPAVSHSLAHLRRIFDDPLLVRRAGKLELSSRAAELMPALTDALAQISTLLDPPKFDPTKAQRLFRLAMSDYGASVLLPDLVHSLRILAPGVDLAINQASREAMLIDVADGETDMALGVFPEHTKGELRMHTLFEEHFECLADASTVPESGGLDQKSWLARPHVLVSMRPGIDNEIDRALAKEGLHRRIAMVLPHWRVANDLIAGTDLILTVAHRSLKSMDRDPRVRIFRPPMRIPPFDFKLVWHQRRDADSAHSWMRQLIMRTLNSDV